MKNVLRFIASGKITVVCIFLLFILTFWGTMAQVHIGLYAAQERFFFSVFFLAMGFLPFPGAQGVLWVMFFNLLASAFVHSYRFKDWRFAGILISHFGLLLYFVASFITMQLSKESYVRLAEGASSNVSLSYADWEIASWQDGEGTRQVTAFDLKGVKVGDVVDLDGFKINVESYFKNCEAYSDPSKKDQYLNASGITVLVPKEMNKEREQNTAGGTFKIVTPLGKSYPVILFGDEPKTFSIKEDGKTHFFALRRSRSPIPFTLKLKEFKAEFHPGTEQAKSYESLVEVIKPNARRDVRIFMNNPLREKDFTFYQSAYDTDRFGRKYSVFAVVQNAGQILPYIASFVVFLGLSLHFIMAALLKKRI